MFFMPATYNVNYYENFPWLNFLSHCYSRLKHIAGNSLQHIQTMVASLVVPSWCSTFFCHSSSFQTTPCKEIVLNLNWEVNWWGRELACSWPSRNITCKESLPILQIGLLKETVHKISSLVSKHLKLCLFVWKRAVLRCPSLCACFNKCNLNPSLVCNC